MFDTETRPKKDKARELAVHNNHKKKPAKCALFLPAENHRCCIEASENGIIDSKTKMIIVERDPKIMPKIKKKYWSLAKKGLLSRDVEFCQSKLHKLDLDPFPAINYAFLDWFDELTADNYGFIAQSLVPKMADGCDIAFTFCVNHWNNKFAKELKSFSEEDLESVKEDVIKTWSWRTGEFKTAMVLVSLRIALNKFEFDKQFDPFPYNDTRKKMLCVRLCNMQRCVNPVFPLELINKVEGLIDDHTRKDSVWRGKRTTYSRDNKARSQKEAEKQQKIAALKQQIASLQRKVELLES